MSWIKNILGGNRTPDAFEESSLIYNLKTLIEIGEYDAITTEVCLAHIKNFEQHKKGNISDTDIELYFNLIFNYELRKLDFRNSENIIKSRLSYTTYSPLAVIFDGNKNKINERLGVYFLLCIMECIEEFELLEKQARVEALHSIFKGVPCHNVIAENFKPTNNYIDQFLIEFSKELYSVLKDNLSVKTINRIYQSCYTKVAIDFQKLKAFEIILHMMPEFIFDQAVLSSSSTPDVLSLFRDNVKKLDVEKKMNQQATKVARIIQRGISSVDESNINGIVQYVSPVFQVGGDLHIVENFKHITFFCIVDTQINNVAGALLCAELRRLIVNSVRKRDVTSMDGFLLEFRSRLDELFGAEIEGINNGLKCWFGGLRHDNNEMQYIGFNMDALYFDANGEHLLKGYAKPLRIDTSNSDICNYSKFTAVDPLSIYLYSDGILKQNGGDFNENMTDKEFNRFITHMHDKPIEVQRKMLTEFMEDWMKNHHQKDDILVMGLDLSNKKVG